MKLKSFIGSTYTLRSVSYDCQRTINLFPEMDETGSGKEGEVAALFSVPGEVLLHQFPRSPIRAIYNTSNNYVIVVAGNGVYTLFSTDGVTWTHTLIAELTTSTGPVSIVDGISNVYNGVVNSGDINSIVLVDGSYNGLAWQEGTTQIYQLNNGNNFVAANFVTFQNGIFIFTQPQSPTSFFCSDPLNINDADEVTNNIGSDFINRVIADHDVLWFFGNRTTAIYQNSGGSGANNTFIQISGASSEAGCNAPYSICKVSGQLIWLANDDRGFGMVVQKEGYVSTRISNHAVEQALQNCGDLGMAIAFSYQDLGHSFYCLNIPGLNTTWAYDLTTRMWSERAFFSNGTFSRDLIDYHTTTYIPKVGTIHLCGDFENGNIYTYSNQVYVQNGQPLYRMRTAPHMSKSLNRLFYSQFQLDMETGVGLDGLGYPVQQGFSGPLLPMVATNVLLQGNGPTFTFVDSNGNPQTPTNTPVITASGTWSNSVSVVGGQVTINPSTFVIPSTNFAIGNGSATNFTLANFPYNTNLSNVTITSEDWRGKNLLQQAPNQYTNLAIESQDFATNAWLGTGVILDPRGWNTGVTTPTTLRPTANTITNGGGPASTTNPTYAYNSTYDTTKLVGNYALCSAQMNGSYMDSSTYFYLKSWGNQFNVSGILSIAITTTTPAPYIPNIPIAPVVELAYSIDAGATWNVFGVTISESLAFSTLVFNSTYLNGIIFQGSDWIASAPLEIPLTIPDTSKFMLLINVSGGVAGQTSTTTAQVYDCVFLAATTGTGTQINAPDSQNTGLNLIEATNPVEHSLITPFTSTIGKPVTASVYYRCPDARTMDLFIQTSPFTFTGQIATNQLTVISQPASSTIGVGSIISGLGIPPNIEVTAGTASPYTLSSSCPTISAEQMTSSTFIAKSNFNATGSIISSVGTATVTPVGTLLLGSILGNQLTVGIQYSGTLAIGQTLTGDNIPAGVTILSGTASPYTLSYTFPTQIDNEFISVTTGAISTGIYRATVTGTELVTGNSQAGVNLNDLTSDYKNFYVGNGASRIQIWGFQVQEDASASPYIKTEGLVASDFATVNLETGTILYNVAPLNNAIQFWTGDILGISPSPVEFYASFTYQAQAPNYVYTGTTPQVNLSYSDDGGHTFSQERAVSCGKIGQYYSRAIWRRLGTSRDRVFRVTCSDPVKISFIGAELAVTESELGPRV